MCVVCLLWPAAAHAQLTAPRERAQIEYGPVSLYPSLQVVDAGKDSNVFDDSKDPKEDYTFTVASRALVVTRLGANELMLSTGSDYVWFQQYAQERSANALYALRFNFSASRFKPFVGAQRSRTRSRPNAEIEARARRLERNVTVGSNFDLSERTGIMVSATAGDSTYAEGESFRGRELEEFTGSPGTVLHRRRPLYPDAADDTVDGGDVCGVAVPRSRARRDGLHLCARRRIQPGCRHPRALHRGHPAIPAE